MPPSPASPALDVTSNLAHPRVHPGDSRHGCRDCPEAVASARTLGQDVACPSCGTYYGWTGPGHDELPPVPLRRRNARKDMMVLARWRPLLEGRALAPSPVAGDGNRGGTSPHALEGRPDGVDAHNPEIRRALAAESRLAAMSEGAPARFSFGTLQRREGEHRSAPVALMRPAIVCLALDVEALGGKGTQLHVAIEHQLAGEETWWEACPPLRARSPGILRRNVSLAAGSLRVCWRIAGSPVAGTLRWGAHALDPDPTQRRTYILRRGLQRLAEESVEEDRDKPIGERRMKPTAWAAVRHAYRLAPAYQGRGVCLLRARSVPSEKVWRSITRDVARPSGTFAVTGAVIRERARYAAVVWHAYGVRGELINLRESAPADIAARFATCAELAGFASRHPDWTPEAVVIGVGNALLGAATAAYEDDVWSPVLPAAEAAAGEPPTSARARFVHGLVERWRAAGGPKAPQRA